MNSAAGCLGYPVIEAAGSPCELGRQHGEQARSQIAGFLDYLARSLQLSRPEMCRRARRFRPLFERACPHLLDEIDALAEGARLSSDEALAVQLRGELGHVTDEACTSFVVGPQGTGDGRTLIGQTSDMSAEIVPFAYVLRLAPVDRPKIVMWTFGGMIGYHGLNACGVAQFANSLGGGPERRFALSHYPLKRLILEQETLDDVIRLMHQFPVGSNGNYVLSDGRGSYLDVELTSTGAHIIDDAGKGFIAHSNHFLCPEHASQANFDRSLPDSFPRLNRMRELLQSRLGAITLDDLKAFLSDHSEHPTGICRHPHDGFGDDVLPNTGYTVAALIAEPMRGRLHVCRGNPCQNGYMSYRVDGADEP